MIKILIATPRKEALSDFHGELEKNGGEISWADSCHDVLAKAREKNFDLVIMDEDLSGGTTGLDCIRKLISSNPFVNCAAITRLSPEDFHEASEGLGVLTGLPENPGKRDAKRLMESLENILNLMNEVKEPI